MSPFPFLILCLSLSATHLHAQQSPTSSSRPAKKPTATSSTLDPGAITNGIYRNKTLNLACKIPDAWVIRTDELNTREEGKSDSAQAPGSIAKVLLAAFSRPPEAKGEEINSSILIAAENQTSYPGLRDAAQYFGPLTEVAEAQGFSVDEEPYEIGVGTKSLVRADFHKDVGTRVMRQSTLALLSHGYAVSITVIASTEDDVEELIDGLSFSASSK